MSVILEKKKAVGASPSINVRLGSFALDNTPLRFETCRERFAKHFNEKHNKFFFKHGRDKGVEVATFVRKIEDILGLNLNQRSKFSKTNRDTILWVESSVFWSKCPMKRSLYTILLRAGLLYESEKDNLEEALFSEKYVKRTKRAVMRFLFGFTEYNDEIISIDGAGVPFNTGWVKIFEKKNDDFLISNLNFSARKYKKKSLTHKLSKCLWVK